MCTFLYKRILRFGLPAKILNALVIPLMRAMCINHGTLPYFIVSTNYDVLFFISLSHPETSLTARLCFRKEIYC